MSRGVNYAWIRGGSVFNELPRVVIYSISIRLHVIRVSLLCNRSKHDPINTKPAEDTSCQVLFHVDGVLVCGTAWCDCGSE